MNKKNHLIINLKSVLSVLLLLYFISISAYRLGSGFDAIFVRIIFFIILIVSIIYDKKLHLTPVLKWNLAFWLYYFLSCLWAKSSADTLNYVNLFVQILGVYIFIPKIIKDKNDIDNILKLFLYSLLYTAILLIIRTPMSVWGTERMGNIIGLNANDFGFRMPMRSILSLYFISRKKTDFTINETKKYKKIFYIILFFIFTVLAFFSGSKKALLLVVVGIVLLEILNSKGLKGIKYTIITSIIVTSIFYIIFNVPILYNVLGIRVQKTFYTLSGSSVVGVQDNSLIERRFFISKGIELFKEHPILGYGGNNFRTYMKQIGHYFVAYSHNNYIELLSTLGIVGFTIYYSYIIYMVFKLLKIIIMYKDNNLAKLFFTVLVIFLILDYGKVSYISEINAILYCIISLYIIYFEEVE